MAKIITTELWIEMAKSIHGNVYDYSKVKYVNNREPVCIICPKHGEFFQVPYAHLAGKGCPICGKIKKAVSKTSNTEKWIEKAKKVHGDKYDYSISKYTGSTGKIAIICHKHGVFIQRACDHLTGYGCPKCGYESVSEKLSDTKNNFVKKANEIYGDKYSYDNFVYINNKTPSYVTCKIHGDFLVRPDNHLTGRSGCPHCTAAQSKWEIEINNFLKECGIDFAENDKTVLDGGFELDVFCQSLNIAIEYDGLYWHSEKFKNKNYHINKTIECNKKGIRLIHIFEDEWINKSEIVKSRLKNIFGITDEKMYARKCKIKEISSKEAKEFVEKTHIQGNVYGKINIGLFHDKELVSLMVFGSKRKNLGSVSSDGEYELLRFCSKLNTVVVGGAGKLFKYFLKKYSPKSITSYCDLRWSVGNLYEKLGFSLVNKSEPNYFYVVNNIRKNRFCYRKDILVKEGFDANKTEHQIMLGRKIYRIYDCGCNVYKYITQK